MIQGRVSIMSLTTVIRKRSNQLNVKAEALRDRSGLTTITYNLLHPCDYAEAKFIYVKPSSHAVLYPGASHPSPCT